MKKTILKSLIASFVFVLWICVFWFVFYKVYAVLSTVSSGTLFSSTNWNDVVNKINSLESTIFTLQTTVTSQGGTITSLQSTNTSLQTQISAMKRVDVPSSDTALFDLNCERRFYWDWWHYYFITAIRADKTRLFRAYQEWSNPWSNRYTILYTDKTKIRIFGNDTVWSTITNLQKKCQN